MTDGPERKYLPVADAAALCGVSVRTVYSWIEGRKVEFRKRRGVVRYVIPEDALEPFLPRDFPPDKR